ncbi:hypothetical protein ANN_20716 [Periplaneta americana]|uniref:Thymidylate kinase-like domain-containing protein n=1 Tax=Periplaneta americana TaxID=6978 RepID=A0ABQ8SDC7_PERAM|nr:hypothetical protein ANN_20716 [Periplaneta americana]
MMLLAIIHKHAWNEIRFESIYFLLAFNKYSCGNGGGDDYDDDDDDDDDDEDEGKILVISIVFGLDIRNSGQFGRVSVNVEIDEAKASKENISVVSELLDATVMNLFRLGLAMDVKCHGLFCELGGADIRANVETPFLNFLRYGFLNHTSPFIVVLDVETPFLNFLRYGLLNHTTPLSLFPEEELLEAAEQKPSLRLTFLLRLTENTEVSWETVLWQHRLYIQVPSYLLPEGSKEGTELTRTEIFEGETKSSVSAITEGFVSLLEYAEEVLKCTHIIVCFKKDRNDREPIPDYRYVMTETYRGFSSVYHSLDAILAYLKNGERMDFASALDRHHTSILLVLNLLWHDIVLQFAQMPEVQKLLAIFSDNYPERSGLDSDVLHSHPFIVFEGLDGAGKTTNVKKLTEFLQGQTVSTPPNCMLPLRDHFNQQPAALKRAYYGLGNYIAGRHVETLLNSHAVIMDRFWHSTAAYAIAEEVKTVCLQLPQEGDPLYRWPSDLVKPDLVLFLELDESARSSRHRCRNTTNTEEEQQLLWDNLYRERLFSTDNMGGVTVGGRRIKCIRFADDMTLAEEEMLLELSDSCEQYGMKINANKMKTIVIGRKVKKAAVHENNIVISEVGSPHLPLVPQQ